MISADNLMMSVLEEMTNAVWYSRLWFICNVSEGFLKAASGGANKGT